MSKFDIYSPRMQRPFSLVPRRGGNEANAHYAIGILRMLVVSYSDCTSHPGHDFAKLQCGYVPGADSCETTPPPACVIQF